MERPPRQAPADERIYEAPPLAPQMLGAISGTSEAPRTRPRPLYSREAHPIQRDLTRFAWLFFVLNLVLIALMLLYAGSVTWGLVALAMETGELSAILVAVVVTLALCVGAAVAALLVYFEFLLLRAVAVAVKCLAAIADHTR